MIDLRAKPKTLVDLYERAKPGSRGGAFVPLLEHDGAIVVESVDVARYVDEIPSVCERRLAPAGAGAAGAAIDAFLVAWPDVEAAYYRVLTAPSQTAADAAAEAFVDELRNLDALLPPDGGPFLLGGDFSLAECVAAPWVQRWAVTLPKYRRLDAERDLFEPNGLDRLAAWARAVRARPSAVATAAPDAEMLAAAERYYVTFTTR